MFRFLSMCKMHIFQKEGGKKEVVLESMTKLAFDCFSMLKVTRQLKPVC